MFVLAVGLAALGRAGVSEAKLGPAMWLALIGGLVVVAPTAVTGFADWLQISWGTAMWRTATMHLTAMVTAVALFAVAAWLQWPGYRHGTVTGGGASTYVWKKRSESAPTAFGVDPVSRPQARPGAYAPSAHGVPLGSLTEEPSSAAQATKMPPSPPEGAFSFGALRTIAYCLPACTVAGAEKKTAVSVGVVVGENAKLVDASGVATSGWPFASTGAIATVIGVVLPQRDRTTSVSVPVRPAVNVCACQLVGYGPVQPLKMQAGGR